MFVWGNNIPLLPLSLGVSLSVCVPLSHSQTSQGVQPKRFKTLPELVLLYLQPSQGLVTTLLYPVDREETAITDDRDYSGNSNKAEHTIAMAVFLTHSNSAFL